MMELLIAIISGLISGFIWGYAGFKFISTYRPNKDEVKIAAVLFTIAAWSNLLCSVIAFLVLISDKFKMGFFMKSPEVIEKEQNCKPSELREYKKKELVKRTLKYYLVVGVILMVGGFCYGMYLGIQEILYRQNTPYYYQPTPPPPVYMEL